MLALPQPQPLVSSPRPGLETVIESQDARWVVIARYQEQARVVRMCSFSTYQQARQYEADLHTGAAV